MSDNSEFILDDNEQEPGKLRQLLKQAHAQLRQKDQRIAELETVETARTVQATWDELQVPDRIRKLYQGEQTPEAMKLWFEEYRDIFNVEIAEKAPVESQQTPEQAAEQAAAQSFHDASTLGSDTLNSGMSLATAKAEAAKAAARQGGRSAAFEAARAEAYKAMGTKEY